MRQSCVFSLDAERTYGSTAIPGRHLSPCIADAKELDSSATDDASKLQPAQGLADDPAADAVQGTWFPMARDLLSGLPRSLPQLLFYHAAKLDAVRDSVIEIDMVLHVPSQPRLAGV